MANSRRTAFGRATSPIVGLTAAAALFLLCMAGCQPASPRAAVCPAPAMAANSTSPEDAYWRNRYQKNRPTPPENYQVAPVPPRDNRFGEFDDALFQGLDRQPSLPALPADSRPAVPVGYHPPEGESTTWSMPGGGNGSDAFVSPSLQPAGIAAEGRFYPVEQLVYGGDYPGLDRPGDYRLMPKDIVTVAVRDHPEFSGTMEIQPDGTVRIPNLHDLVRLRGFTVAEAAEELRRTLSVYVRGECQVKVQANRARGGYYFVFGDVLQPGRFPMGMEPVKLSDAVLAANWETSPTRRDLDGEELGPSFPAATPRGRYVAPPTADLARVMLITPHRSKPVRTSHDLRQAMLGVAGGDPVIRPGQIVVVPSLDPGRNRALGLDEPSALPVAGSWGGGFSGASSAARLPEAAPPPHPQVDAATADSWSVSAVDANMATAFDNNLNTGVSSPPRRARTIASGEKTPPQPNADNQPKQKAPPIPRTAKNGPGGWAKGL